MAIRNRGYAISSIDPAVLENSSAAVREQGATLPVIAGISHVTPSLHSVSATYGTGWDSIGGQNEALHRQYSPPQEDVAPLAGARRSW